jgi:hypothetical protein
MKNKVILLLIVLISTVVNSQIVDIPDANLKFILITYPVADLGNGFNEIADTNGDGEIQEIEAEAVLGLVLVEQSIADLEGLQYFINLEEIDCSQNGLIDYVPTTFWPNLKYLESDMNNITTIDVSQNSFLEILILSLNPLTTIDVSQNPVLKELSLSGCQLSVLNITQNSLLEILWCNGNQLINLDVIQNTNLTYLTCGSNFLTAIDTSNNSNLTHFSCYNNSISTLDLSQNFIIKNVSVYNNQLQSLDLSQNIYLEGLSCFNNQLTILNIKNGYNNILTSLRSYNNPNLTCIQVDDVDYANNAEGWNKDSWAEYSEICVLGIEDNLQSQFVIYPNPVKDVLMIYNESVYEVSSVKVFDSLGRLVLEQNNPSNQLDVSNLSSGLLFVQIETEKGIITKRIIKE